MIISKENIIEYFKSGIKDEKVFKIGIEHEKFLFDGKKNIYNEKDKAKPINSYGLTKLKGEKSVHTNHKCSIVLRTNFVEFLYLNERFKNFRFFLVLLSIKISSLGLTDSFIIGC